jgi:hypothetical protein
MAFLGGGRFARRVSDSGEKDLAFAIVGEHAQPIDPEVERRVVRKIDLFLIPSMLVGESSNLPMLYVC